MRIPRLNAFDPPATPRGNTGADKGVTIVRAASVLVVMAAAAMATGCISVNAPDKPIVIELNINIKQEVIYRLAEDVKRNIDENSDIF